MKHCILAIGLLVILLQPATTWAQAHPCDTFAPQAAVPLGAVTMDMCWSEKNQAGQPTPAKSYAIIFDGTRTPIVMTKTTPTASASGLFLFSGPYTLTTAGTHTVIFEVTIDNGTGGNLATQSAPLTLQVQAAVPSPPQAPAKTRVLPSSLR